VLHRSFTREDAPEVVAQRIREVADQRAGIIVVAQDHPAIVAALRKADAQNVPVVLLVSDLRYCGKAVYVGIDNESAGRTAGFFIRHLLQGRVGRVIALCHSGSYVTHRQRMIGFARHFSQPGAPLVFTHCLAGRDSDELSYRLVLDVLRQFNDVIGIYNAGGAHRGVEQALRERRRLAKIAYIGHELSPETRSLLQSGAMMLAIDQMPELQVRRAIEVLERLIGLRAGPVDRSPISFRIVTVENLDS
jgi:LacI family transcriptional regulator